MADGALPVRGKSTGVDDRDKSGTRPESTFPAGARHIGGKLGHGYGKAVNLEKLRQPADDNLAGALAACSPVFYIHSTKVLSGSGKCAPVDTDAAKSLAAKQKQSYTPSQQVFGESNAIIERG